MRHRLIATAALLQVLGACAQTEPQPDPEAVAPVVAEPAEPGVVTGRVFLDGQVDRELLDMSADQVCLGLHDHAVEHRGVLVDDAGHLENVFVSIREGLSPADYGQPTATKLLDQSGCLFTPRVQGVRVGQKLVVRNSDPTLHNVQANTVNNPPFNFGQPFQGMETELVFANAEEMIRVRCDVHPWMTAYLAIVEHPFFDTTSADGTFTIADVPPGDYRVASWHDVLGTDTRQVTVTSGGVVEIEFRYRPGE